MFVSEFVTCNAYVKWSFSAINFLGKIKFYYILRLAWEKNPNNNKTTSDLLRTFKYILVKDDLIYFTVYLTCNEIN